MNQELTNLQNHSFISTILNDTHKFSLKTDEQTVIPEHEYYVRKTVFYALHLLELCEQLNNAIELLSNFNYSKSIKVTRIEHLKYNIENYIIRLTSISDRLLQLINATFHTGTSEKVVSERTVVTNVKVDRTGINQHYKELNKTIRAYVEDRNAIVHRHTILNKQLDQFHLFYHEELTQEYIELGKYDEASYKQLRKKILSDFVSNKKDEFKEINKKCFTSILPIFDLLQIEYTKQTKALI